MAEWQGYLSQARKFWEVAEAVNDPEHTSQAASNALLTVIAANDAVCLRLAGRKPGGESHTAAAEILREAFTRAAETPVPPSHPNAACSPAAVR